MTTNSRSKLLRRQYWINPKFQLSFLLYTLGIAVVTLAVFYAAKVVFFRQTGQYLLSIGIPNDHIVYEFLNSQSRVMDWIFVGAAFIEIAFLAVAGLLMSHRVAGPLYRLTQDMLAMAKGSPPKQIRFRNGDYFPELAEAFNEQARRYHKDLGPAD